jgi:HSP20 family protein
MRLIKFKNDPFFNSEVSTLFDSLFGKDMDFAANNWRHNVPAVNVKETENSFRIEVAAPGLKKEDFKLSVENDVLTISSEVKNETETKDEKYQRKEFGFSSFQRSFTLSEEVNKENIQARYTDGILYIELSKLEQVKPQPKTIEIQ